MGRVPLHTLEGIVCFSYPGASPALMGKCARLGVDLSFFSPQGRFLARAVGEERGNVLLRQTQYRIADSEAESCLYARNFILGKVYNARWVLERATRDHPSGCQWNSSSAPAPSWRRRCPSSKSATTSTSFAVWRARRHSGISTALIHSSCSSTMIFFFRRPEPPPAAGQYQCPALFRLFASGLRLHGGSSECGPRPLRRLSPPRPARAQEPRPRPHGRAACSLCRPLRALLHQPENHDAEAFPEAGERGRPSHR